jgi:hypothetical protein
LVARRFEFPPWCNSGSETLYLQGSAPKNVQKVVQFWFPGRGIRIPQKATKETKNEEANLSAASVSDF